MSSKPIVGFLAAAVLAGTVTVAVMATSADPSAQGESVLRHLHAMAQHLHGSGHHPPPMAELIDRLELTPEQRRRLDSLHEIVATHGETLSGSMVELHERLVAQFEQGPVDSAEIRRVVDSQVEQLRETAYAATDELVALVNGLDSRQRDIVLEHLRRVHVGSHGHGPAAHAPASR